VFAGSSTDVIAPMFDVKVDTIPNYNLIVKIEGNIEFKKKKEI
jgi:hypothetical protein